MNPLPGIHLKYKVLFSLKNNEKIIMNVVCCSRDWRFKDRDGTIKGGLTISVSFCHRGHMSERFFRSNRPGYPHPVSSELENSGIRVAVDDCSVTERQRWRPPYLTGKTVHVHAKHYKHNEDGRTAPGVCGNGFVPLSHSGNVVTRIGIHTHTHQCHFVSLAHNVNTSSQPIELLFMVILVH